MPFELNSADYFEKVLKPYLQHPRFKTKIQVGHNMIAVNGELQGMEYTVKAKGSVNEAIGLEPMALRHSCLDDVKQVADFLLMVGTGRLHPSAYAYLLGPFTQYQMATGKRKGFSAMSKDAPKEKATPTDKIMKDFDEAIALDTDVKRVARKKNFDQQLEEKILGTRPHLLERKD